MNDQHRIEDMDQMRKFGAYEEQQRIMQLLKQLGVIRDSMLGDKWKVIYTEKGAMDITLDRLEGKQ